MFFVNSRYYGRFGDAHEGFEMSILDLRRSVRIQNAITARLGRLLFNVIVVAISVQSQRIGVNV